MSTPFQERMAIQIKEIYSQFNLSGTIEYLALREGTDYYSLTRRERKNALSDNYIRWYAAATFDARHPEFSVV